MQNDPQLTLQARYAEAFNTYRESSQEGDLLAAYDLARAALDLGLPISRLFDMHRSTTSGLTRPLEKTMADRFFQGALAAYDMALQGCRKTAARLSDEVVDRKETATTLREAGVDLTRQRDTLRSQLHQVTEEQTAFTYAISHDLMSPLNTLRNLLSCHGEDLDAAGVAMDLEALNGARASADRMQRIVEDIQAYALAVGLEDSAGTVDLNVLLGEVLARAEPQIEASGARVDIEALPVVKGQAAQLRLVFEALLSNALKFNEKGEAPEITIRAVDGAKSCAEIQVADRGIGIAAPHLDRIFGLFQRLHTYEAYPGTGLGLTLCRRLLGQNGGEIAVASTLGEGSVFTVTLPVA
ncbi:MAG: ATP-binding protein [Silicimonas sp.]|nr:ATP-binding protein [Silicimonas sp.]